MKRFERSPGETGHLITSNLKGDGKGNGNAAMSMTGAKNGDTATKETATGDIS